MKWRVYVCVRESVSVYMHVFAIFMGVAGDSMVNVLSLWPEVVGSSPTSFKLTFTNTLHVVPPVYPAAKADQALARDEQKTTGSRSTY